MASATKEARKKRMARQRRASSLHSHRSQQQQQQNHHQAESSSLRVPAEGASSSSSNANNNNSNNDNNNNRSWSFWSSTSSSRQKNPMMEAPPPPKSSMQQPQLSPSMPPKQQQQQQNSHRDAASAADRRQGLKGEKNLRFLFQKVLKQSDVGSLGRIVLPKKEAEIHLPELETRDGMSIPMEDIGTSQIWNMRYRFWPNNKSRMYLLENTGEFVRSNGLQEGDFIVIYSDMKCGKYMIRGVKVPQQPERGQANRSVARSHLKRSSWERGGSTTRMRGSSSHDGINDDPGMPSSSAASPFMIKMEASP